jgi:NADH-quinone oxidoreductase subunit I
MSSKVQNVAQVSRDASLVDQLFLPAIASGMKTTIRHFLKNVFSREKYITTIQYPEVKTVYPERFRGMHRLVQREDGEPRCVACFMCATACPARCIHIEAGETEDSSIEKFPIVFDIDELRCVVCGLCVEACPCDAIRMDTGIHPAPVYSSEEGTFGRNDLLAINGRDQSLSPNLTPPPATAAGTGRVDRSEGDGGAGGSRGGY